MNWKAAVDKFEEKRLEIWENMPQDVYDLSNGIVPGDTNVYGQYVTTIMYADSEMRTLCDEELFYFIETARDESSDLKTIINNASRMFDYKEKFLTFTGLPIASEMLRMYMDALSTVDNRQQFIDLSNAALKYFNRHHMWVDLIFPWGVFNGFIKQDFSKYLKK